MAEATKMRQSTNVVVVEGYLDKKNLEVKTSTKDGSVFISGSLDVRVDKDNVVTVEVYSKQLKKDGGENKIFASLKSVMEQYVDATMVEDYTQADRIRITQGQIRTNEFVGRDGQIAVATKYATNFVNRVQDASFAPKATFRIELVVRAVRTEEKDGEETGRGFIDGFYVDYSGNLQPLTLVAEGKTFTKLEGGLEAGETVTFWGNIISSVSTQTILVEADFGDDEEKVITRTRKERMVTGAKIQEEGLSYKKKDINAGLKAKSEYHEQLKSAKTFNENTPVPQTKPEEIAPTNQEADDEQFPWEDE